MWGNGHLLNYVIMYIMYCAVLARCHSAFVGAQKQFCEYMQRVAARYVSPECLVTPKRVMPKWCA